ncbi:MAG: phosphatidate cytidylyltransferase [Actinobacteria bacterium]|nr:phosphatidate cytidylyltransferase [Actinomycetota bacterium]MCL5447068.1 phosphatidate cytidylyltransferase [Actinomycetota bacterium]
MAEDVYEEPTPTQQVRISDARLAAEIVSQDADGVVDDLSRDVLDGGGEPVSPVDQVAQAVPDDLVLPSWTDPPTGTVPAVLREIAREVGDTEEQVQEMAGEALQGPAWREQAHEWEALDVDVGTLFSDVSGGEQAVAASHELPGDGYPAAGSHDIDEAGANVPVGSGSGDRGPAERRLHGEDVHPGIAGDSGTGDSDWNEGVSRGGKSAGVNLSSASGDVTDQAGTGGYEHEHSSRNLVTAVASGLAIGGLALLSFHFGNLAAVIFCTIIVVLSTVECFATLRRARRHPITLIGLAGTVAAMVAAYNSGPSGLMVVITAVTMFTGIWLVMVPRSRVRPVTRAGATIFGFMWIGFLGSYSALLLDPAGFAHRHGIAFLLGAIIATVATDVGAYAVGSLAGRHHMAPVVSPHKTWEGYAGAVVASVVVSGAILPRISPWTLSSSILLGIVVAVVAPLGDLLESMIKRELGVKDMGFVLPGHGGLLDRIDGLLFALPVTFFLVTIVKP